MGNLERQGNTFPIYKKKAQLIAVSIFSNDFSLVVYRLMQPLSNLFLNNPQN